MLEPSLLMLFFCYQSLLPENHFLPKETVTKYQGKVSFATVLGKIQEINVLRNHVKKVFQRKVRELILIRFIIQLYRFSVQVVVGGQKAYCPKVVQKNALVKKKAVYKYIDLTAESYEEYLETSFFGWGSPSEFSYGCSLQQYSRGRGRLKSNGCRCEGRDGQNLSLCGGHK